MDCIFRNFGSQSAPQITKITAFLFTDLFSVVLHATKQHNDVEFWFRFSAACRSFTGNKARLNRGALAVQKQEHTKSTCQIPSKTEIPFLPAVKLEMNHSDMSCHQSAPENPNICLEYQVGARGRQCAIQRVVGWGTSHSVFMGIASFNGGFTLAHRQCGILYLQAKIGWLTVCRGQQTAQDRFWKT